MSESNSPRLQEVLSDGWRIVTHSIDSPVCSKAEAYFAQAFEDQNKVEDPISRVDSASVRVLLARNEFYRRVQMSLTLLRKKRVAYGRSNALVTGGPFQGWIVASSGRQQHYLLARPTFTHMDSADFDRIKAQFAVDPITDIPHVGRRELWINEFMAYCYGSNVANSPESFLEGEDVVSLE